MIATLTIYDKPGVSSEGTVVATASGDTIRRALSKLADQPALRKVPSDLRAKVEFKP